MEIPYTERCDRCGKTYGDHCGNECPDERGSFTLQPPMNATQPDPKSIEAIQLDLEEALTRIDNLEADKRTAKRLSAECDALKASNAELREHRAADAKFISELQHTVRLVQGTHAQQVKECAERASGVLVDKFYGQLVDYAFRSKIEVMICEAFSAPVKDECEEAWLEWVKSIETECHDWESFEAGWKLAKGKP